jgi:antitoxin VapB
MWTHIMTSAAATTFRVRQVRSGNSQAVRLPAKIAYAPGTELNMTRIGEKIIIEPAADSMEGFINFILSIPPGADEDFQRIEADLPERDWS